MTIPAKLVDESFFDDGKMFDGSSIAGWKGINESDMLLMPDACRPPCSMSSPRTRPSTSPATCSSPPRCRAIRRCPRTLAKRAEEYLKSTGIADQAFFGPENEFFVFDDVRYGANINGAFYSVDSSEASWNSNRAEKDGGNIGHRPGIKGGYFPVPPVDSLHDIRSAMCLALEQMGLGVEVHHHEVATAGQCEIGVKFGHLVQKADHVQILKYVVQNVAHSYGKTATFMPKPLVGDNGSGMHVHQSLAKGGKNIFAGDKYGGLSDTALYYIGGILKHAKALNAFTNPGTNSYKRLVPGLRGAGDARLLGAQPLGVDPHPVYRQPEGPPHRGALPGQHGESLPRLRGDDDGGAGWHQEQDPSRAKPWTRTCTTCRRRKRRRFRRSPSPSSSRWRR